MELCRRLQAGEEAALDALLASEWSHLVAYAEAFTADADGAEEMAQRAFVRLWQYRERLDPDGSIRALLYRTVRNLCIDWSRKKRVRREAAHVLAARQGEGATPYEALRERELREAVEAAVEGLSPRRQEAFMLCRIHGLAHREAADVMGLAAQTVANHVTAALKHIRRELDAQLA